MIVPFALPVLAAAAVATVVLAADSDGLVRSGAETAVRAAPVPARVAPVPVGDVGVKVPTVAVVRIERGRLLAAWTNTSAQPRGGEQVYVAGDGPSLARTASPAETRALVRCAQEVRHGWAPGRWVRLTGPHCRL